MIARCVPPALLAVVLLTSCRKPAVESYRVPKEATPEAPTAAADSSAHPPASTNAGTAAAPNPASAPAPGGNAMAGTPVATATGADLVWTAPPEWKTKTGSAMRKGSYTVTADGVTGEGDLSITAFPGAVGGDLANFNRWRGQVQLPPVAQAEFESATQRLDRNGLHLIVVDIVGAGGKSDSPRILGAMIPFGGNTWFFKLSGPDAVIAKAKPAFMTFLDTVKPGPAAAR